MILNDNGFEGHKMHSEAEGLSLVSGKQGSSVAEKDCSSISILTDKRERNTRAVTGSHHNIFGRFHLVASNDTPYKMEDSRYAYFSIDGVLEYVGFCDDFGPMNLATLYKFCEILDDQMEQNPSFPIAMVTCPDGKALTNAVFLIGSYMIMKLDMPPEHIHIHFLPFQANLLSYRDVSPGDQNFALHVRDCWNGLSKAKSLGWISFEPNAFDIAEYSHYDNPLNADLHEVIPGKFVAMRGPRDLPGGRPWKDVHHPDGSFSHRDFSPQHYVEIFHELQVGLVVRLNDPQYRTGTLTDAGIALADLFFEDCTIPPPDVVAKFLMLAEGLHPAGAALAVHCKAGLGRTGTLIALYMMKHWGFSAREAMGWLRIVRPGSVIGKQQEYLCGREAHMRRAGERFRAEGGPKLVADGPSAEAAQRFFGMVRDYVDVRLRARAAAEERARAAAGKDGGDRGAGAHHGLRLGCAGKDGDCSGQGVLPRSPSNEALAAHVAAATDRRNGLRAGQGGAPPAPGMRGCRSLADGLNLIQ